MMAGQSSFARAVLDHIGTPGEDISTMMINVEDDVIAATGGRQTPTVWDVSTSQSPSSPAIREALSQEAQLRAWRRRAVRHLDQGLSRAFPEGAHAEDLRKLALPAADMRVAARIRTQPTPYDHPAGGGDEPAEMRGAMVHRPAPRQRVLLD